jgi:hypothetical protein
MSLWILPKIDHALHVWASSTELVEYEDWARGDVSWELASGSRGC